MKLQQGQQWNCGNAVLRIVRLERLAVEYKTVADAATGETTHHRVTKKEFCRLVKGAALLPPTTP
jgi:hypothetical protein